ncbi:MAG: DUF4835 family protein, partial [Coleofasciculaceae cyanobacterium SM2_3_26]|nr:DUF4835 family protein [Coleofasciculaceae cyanobacterium SM2_3_26]
RYINYQKWGADEFQGFERIRCNLQIIVTDRPSPDYFTCTANLQVYRPAYNTTYETLLLNIQDERFHFRYVPFQQMTFVDNTYNDNLTALLNFYAYLILAFDYDSYAPTAACPIFRRPRRSSTSPTLPPTNPAGVPIMQDSHTASSPQTRCTDPTHRSDAPIRCTMQEYSVGYGGDRSQGWIAQTLAINHHTVHMLCVTSAA